MFVIIGFVVVIASVLGGFVLEGGPIMVLMQWVEFLIIGGTAIGTLLIGNPPAIIKKIISNLTKTMSGIKINEKHYLELLKLFYEIATVYKKEGAIALEKHIENPEKSTLFKKFPTFIADKHSVELLCDSLRIVD